MIIVYKFNDGSIKNIEYNEPSEMEKILNELKFYIMSKVINQKIDLTLDMRNKFDITVDGEKIESKSNNLASIELKLI